MRIVLLPVLAGQTGVWQVTVVQARAGAGFAATAWAVGRWADISVQPAALKRLRVLPDPHPAVGLRRPARAWVIVLHQEIRLHRPAADPVKLGVALAALGRPPRLHVVAQP